MISFKVKVGDPNNWHHPSLLLSSKLRLSRVAASAPDSSDSCLQNRLIILVFFIGSRFARVLSNDLYECKSKGSFNNCWLMSLGSLEVSDCPVSPLCSERLDRLEENEMGNGPEIRLQ